MTKSPWGDLGKPPQWVLEGSPHLVDQYRKMVEEEARIKRMPSKMRTVRMAELRARFNRDFPKEKPSE